MGRVISRVVLFIYLITVPAGVYAYLSSNATGYPTKVGGVLVAGLALVGLLLIPLVEPAMLRRNDLKSDSNPRGNESE